MRGTTPKACESPPASGAQSVSKKKSARPTTWKKLTASLASVMTMPVVVRTDRRAAAASRPLMACSPADRRVRVRYRALAGSPPWPENPGIWLPATAAPRVLLGLRLGLAALTGLDDLAGLLRGLLAHRDDVGRLRDALVVLGDEGQKALDLRLL